MGGCHHYNSGLAGKGIGMVQVHFFEGKWLMSSRLND